MLEITLKLQKKKEGKLKIRRPHLFDSEEYFLKELEDFWMKELEEFVVGWPL